MRKMQNIAVVTRRFARGCGYFASLAILLGIVGTDGALRAEVDNTGTDGITVNLDVATPRLSDGLTGSGNLSLVTTGEGFVINDPATYGTYQFNPGATFTDFTGGIQHLGAVIDLNGNAVTVKNFVPGTVTVGEGEEAVTTTDTASSIINTAGTQATLTLTLTGTENATTTVPITLGKSDGTDSDIRLVWDTTGLRTFNSKHYHTGGTSFTGGSLDIRPSSSQDNLLGSGDIMLDSVSFYASNHEFTFTNNFTLQNELITRQQGGAGVRFSGKLEGDSDLLIAFDGGSTILNGEQKTYTGKTVIGTTRIAWNDPSAKATLSTETDNVLPATTTIEMGSAYSGSFLNLNGTTQTVKGLSGTGTISGNGINTSTLNVTDAVTAGRFTVNDATLNLQSGDFAGLSFLGTGKVAFTGGATTIVTDEMSIVNLAFDDDMTIRARPVGWGVTTWATDREFSSPSAPHTYTKDASLLNVTTGDKDKWPDNTTNSFSGYVNLTEATTLSFMKNFDDRGVIYLTPVNEDGSLGAQSIALRGLAGNNVGVGLYKLDSEWEQVIVNEVNLTPGRYFLDIRGGQGGGGLGRNYTGNELGFGVKTGGNTTLENINEYHGFTIDENNYVGGIPVLVATSPAINFASSVNIPDGKTLTLDAGENGFINATGRITGNGKVVLEGNGNLAEVRLTNALSNYTGGTDVNVANLTIGADTAIGTGTITFNTPATTVTLDPTSNKGWSEGVIPGGSLNTTDMPEVVTNTANTTETGKTTNEIATWVYQSSPLEADNTFTMYFGKMYDDVASLKITDLTTSTTTDVGFSSVWNVPEFSSYEFTEGHRYAIDLRVCNTGGGGGAVTGNTNTSGMPDGVGIGASITGLTDGKGNDSFALMNFDTDGVLIGSPLHTVREIVLDQDMVLNGDVTIDAAKAQGVTLNGRISGDGTLGLKNGSFRTTNRDNTVGGLAIEDAEFYISDANGEGIIQVDGDLKIHNSTMYVDLSGLAGQNAWTWLTMGEDATVDIVDTEWFFTGTPGDMATTATLIDRGAPEDWAENITPRFDDGVAGALIDGGNGSVRVIFGTPDAIAAALPEPTTWVLLVLGACGLFYLRRNR